MVLFNNVLSIVTKFLKEAHSLGLIKEFNLIHCEQQMSENEISGTDDLLLTTFFKNLHSAYEPGKNYDCSMIKYEKETKEENMANNKKEPGTKNDCSMIKCDKKTIEENVSEDKREPVKTDDCSVIKCDKETKENMSEDKKVNENRIEKNSHEMQVDANEELTKSSSCSVNDVEEINEVKKSEDNKVVEPPVEKDIDEMEVDTNEISEIEEHSKEELVQMPVDNNEISKIEQHSKEKLVQIQVDTNEMKRRISAFIKRKRKEVDEWNVQEFCGRSYLDEQDPAWEQSNSCARVDVVFVPRRGSRSHIKVSKVKNLYGPQTQLQSESKKIKQEPSEMENQPSNPTLHAIEERLHNMESHLKLKSDLRSNIFQRLKDLENRILLLESTSPEYIHLPNSDYSSVKNKSFDKEKIYLNYSTDELKNRIKNLKESCKVFP